MLQPEFVEAILRAEGVRMEDDPEAVDERVAYWEWEDDDEDAMLRGEEEEEVWE